MDVSGDAMFNIGAGYVGVGRFKEALEMSEKTLAFRRRILPPDHPDIGEFAGFQPLCVDHF